MKLFKPRSLRSAMGVSFSFTVLAKIIGYGRQWLLAYCFGISRDVDIYMMAFGIAMLSVYPFTLWFDQLVLPQLVIVREKKGEAAFRRLCAASFSFSIMMAVGMAFLFLLWIPFASWALSHGFTLQERTEVRHFAYFFIPWILIIFPYNALSAILKSLRYYDLVLTADFLVSCIGTLGFVIWHHHLVTLPLALATGYLFSSACLAWQAMQLTDLWGSPWTEEMDQVFRNFRHTLTIFPIGFIQSSIDRLFQSYLAPGAIAACGYSGQLVAPFLELLAFDETFIVPLSSTEGRSHKVHRLMAGLILCTIPIVLFLMWKSSDVIGVLFQYGHFDLHAKTLTTAIFRILVITLATSTLSTPLVRLLQISNRIYQTSIISLSTGTLNIMLNTLLVYKLRWLVTGTTMANALASVGTLLTAIVITTRAGYPVEWARLGRYFLWAILCSGAAIGIAGLLPTTPVMIKNLVLAGVAFWAVVGLLYWPVRKQIRFILYG